MLLIKIGDMFDELSTQSKVLVVAACSMVTITVKVMDRLKVILNNS